MSRLVANNRKTAGLPCSECGSNAAGLKSFRIHSRQLLRMPPTAQAEVCRCGQQRARVSSSTRSFSPDLPPAGRYVARLSRVFNAAGHFAGRKPQLQPPRYGHLAGVLATRPPAILREPIRSRNRRSLPLADLAPGHRQRGGALPQPPGLVLPHPISAACSAGLALALQAVVAWPALLSRQLSQ